MYDPTTGRFLSPDNYVQFPDYTQAFNRYSYCLNNPLIYTDPDGEFIFTALCLIIPGAQFLLPVAIGADLGMWAGGSAVNGTINPFKWDYSDGKTWAGMGVGALAGGVGGGIGSEVIGGLSGLDAAVMGGMAAGAIYGAGMTAISGGSFSDVMGGMVQGAVIGGFTAAAGYGAFQGLDKLSTYTINGRVYHWPMHNTISYAGSSIASQMTANVMTGQNPFSNLDKAVLNPGIIAPATVDFLSVAVPLALNTKPGTKLFNKIIKNNLPENIDLSIEKLKMYQIETGMLDNENFGIRFEYGVLFPDGDWVQNTLATQFLGYNPYTINLLSRSQYNTYVGFYLNSFRPIYVR